MGRLDLPDVRRDEDDFYGSPVDSPLTSRGCYSTGGWPSEDHPSAWRGSLADAPDTEIAWAAGFLDGEGYTSINSNGRYRTICIAVTQKDLRPLQRFQRIMGIGNILTPEASGVTRWRVSGRKAMAVLERLWPYLSEPKREQALNVLSKLAVEHPLRAGEARDESLPATVGMAREVGDSIVLRATGEPQEPSDG